jgi:Glycoside hydrolase family 44
MILVTKRFGVVAAASLLLLAGSLFALKRRAHRGGSSASGIFETAVTPRIAKPLDVADAGEVIYDGRLMPNWNDWGWGPNELSNHGPAKIAFAGYGGLILQSSTLTTPYSGLSFRYKAPAGWPDFLQVTLKSAGTELPQVAVEARHVALLPDGFREVLLPWSELDPPNAPFDRVVISARVQVGSEPVLVDKILLIRAESTPPAPQRVVALEIQCAAATHPINPMIYGSGDGDWESGTTTRRMGGNPTTRYNWDLQAWNTGKDWFFENVKAPNLESWLAEGAQHHALAAVTVPIIGWVAKDTSSLGFPVSKFSKQEKVDPYRPQAGNGHDASGAPIKPGPPSETSLEATPELVGRWVRGVRDSDQARGSRSVRSYILDNEPSIWDQTHRDVHPDPLTYDELLDRTIRYATEVRKADPDALIAGPAEWGWLGYLYSGKDRVEGKFVRSDRRAHGDEPLIPWYLKKLAQYEKDHGIRLLDVLDVHFYPAASGLYGGDAHTDPAAAELRLRSTRALWDPSYIDESWINEPIQLIPLLKGWIAANYPGLGISLGEWSFGADAHISGALATAEALGRFGQQGIDSAYYWGGPKKDTGTFWAFRAFRNFDGAGGHFFDLSVPTREAEKVSLFASRDESHKHIVAILVNRDPLFQVTARVGLGSCGSVRAQRIFSYAAGSTNLVQRTAAPPTSAEVLIDLQPYSITVLDLQVDAPTGTGP